MLLNHSLHHEIPIFQQKLAVFKVYKNTYFLHLNSTWRWKVKSREDVCRMASFLLKAPVIPSVWILSSVVSARVPVAWNSPPPSALCPCFSLWWGCLRPLYLLEGEWSRTHLSPLSVLSLPLYPWEQNLETSHVLWNPWDVQVHWRFQIRIYLHS